MSDFIPIAIEPPDPSKVADGARRFYVEDWDKTPDLAPVGNTVEQKGSVIPWVIGGVVAAAAFVLLS